MKLIKHGMVLGLFAGASFFFDGLQPLNAQSTFTRLSSFTAESANSPYTNSDGSFPQAELIQSNGILYGVTYQGGTLGNGTIFAVGTNGMGFTNLHSFAQSEGLLLNSALVLGGNTLYGVASSSAVSGTIFSISTNGTNFSILHSFSDTFYDGGLNTYTNNDGANPEGALVLSGNLLYGTTSSGGANGNGTIFALNINTLVLTNLYTFSASPFAVNNDGASPRGLILSGNTLFGTATGGGKTGYGSVFAINTNSTDFTNLYNFSAPSSSPPYTNSDGEYPVGSLVMAGSTLYGLTGSGGSTGNGTVFSLNTNGNVFIALHSFAPGNGQGYQAEGNLTLSGNILFGTTMLGGNLLGTVFSMKTDGTAYTNVYEFTTPVNSTNNDGYIPKAGVLLSGNTLYGVASRGGLAGYGTVFAVSMTPQLGIAPAGNQAVLSWPLWASSYGLQTTTNLVSGSWSNITSGITTAAAGYVSSNAMNSKAAFFRLKSQ